MFREESRTLRRSAGMELEMSPSSLELWDISQGSVSAYDFSKVSTIKTYKNPTVEQDF
jgi:hypothetical protein